jgi:hypothetical protein
MIDRPTGIDKIKQNKIEEIAEIDKLKQKEVYVTVRDSQE